ncbi:DUF63 family protein [Haloarchaeobius amylolyticus]|uniref:DUF63 family protein n=1 Tax=Haloarchaeobius amylolyticus TaxID=1198296 RepID=UPI002271FFC1|nr:DUF63 family protein [Haloarchaeobius amylolyticus]
MQQLRHRIDPFAVWIAAALLGVLALSATAVYQTTRPAVLGFLWPNVLGPIVARGSNSECVVLTDGRVTVPSGECVAPAGAVAAGPDLTVLGAGMLALVLGFFVVGALLLLETLDARETREFFYAVVPFMALTGVLLAIGQGASRLPNGPLDLLPFPFNLGLVTSVVYLSAVTLTVLVIALGVFLERHDRVPSFHQFAASVGAAGLAVALLLGVVLALTTEVGRLTVGSMAGMAVVLVLTTVLAVVVWAGLARAMPDVVTGIGAMGLVVFWAFLLNGVATVVALDWAGVFGIESVGFTPNFVGQIVVALTAALLPSGLGTAWPYLLVQLGIGIVVASSFEESEVTTTTPALLLLTAVVAFGLVTGVQVLVAMTFGL